MYLFSSLHYYSFGCLEMLAGLDESFYLAHGEVIVLLISIMT